MIDWHCHILPGIDDGSNSVEDSLEMLRLLSEQGIETVIATPHFYADEERVEDFLERREESYLKLKGKLFESAPKLLQGAEVRYYSGISKLSELSELCIQNTNLLLLEMPFSKWTEYTVRELTEISTTRDLTLILAHIERYLKLQNQKTWERLFESDILMQVNASFVNNFQTRRKALSMFRKGEIHLLGSDSHNLTSRAPKIGKALELIGNKLGEGYLNQAHERDLSLLNK